MMRLKAKRQNALVHFVNLIDTLEDYYQQHRYTIINIPSIDLNDENDSKLTTIEKVFKTMHNIKVAFAKTHNNLIKSLEYSIEFNKKYKLDYSQEFDEKIRAKSQEMKSRGIFEAELHQPILEASNANLIEAVDLLDTYLSFAAIYTQEARKLIDISQFDYRMILNDELYCYAEFLIKTMDMTRLIDKHELITEFHSIREQATNDDEDSFDFTFCITEHYPIPRKQNLINAKEVERRYDAVQTHRTRPMDESKVAQQQELATMLEHIKAYYIKSEHQEMDFFNEAIAPAFTELNRYGDIQFELIIYRLTQIINDISERAYERPNTKLSGHNLLDFKTFAYFITRVADMNI